MLTLLITVNIKYEIFLYLSFIYDRALKSLIIIIKIINHINENTDYFIIKIIFITYNQQFHNHNLQIFLVNIY